MSHDSKDRFMSTVKWIGSRKMSLSNYKFVYTS